MIYNLIATIACFIVAILIIKNIYKENFNIKNKVIIFEIIVLIIGFIIRIVGIADMPNALNTDEASAGYEAFSILNYGIDRNGNKLPVFLEAWGSGQNALLSYLMIPFIAIIGLNTLAVRLPMAILGCVSLVLFFLILRRITTQKKAMIGLFLFAIFPWHIMKSRWGLEANVFPEVILIFAYMLIRSLQDKNKILYYISFAVAGLSAYAYGTSYFFLPIFIIGILIILIKRKEINVKEALLSIGIVGIISLPIIICIFINYFGGNTIALPFMTIPKLSVMRYESASSLFKGDLPVSIMNNISTTLKILILQEDSLPWNALKISGIFYKGSIVFMGIGIYIKFKKDENKTYDFIFNVWFISSILLSFVCEPNINRLNIMWIPIMYYIVSGINYIIEEEKELEKLILFIYMIVFIIFITEYIKEDASTYSTFNGTIESVVEYINEEKGEKKVYVTNNIKEPYIYFLFYGKYDTREYVNTVKYQDAPESEFKKVLSYGDYYFEDINKIENTNNIYVVKEEDVKKYKLDENKWNIKIIKDYAIIDGK